MKLHINNSVFNMMVSLVDKGFVKKAQTEPQPEGVIDIGNSSLTLFPELKDKIIQNDSSNNGTTIIPAKISKNEDYKKNLSQILDSLKGEIGSAEMIGKIDSFIASLQAIKSGAKADGDDSGISAIDIPARKRGRPPKQAALDLSKLDPSVLPKSAPSSSTPSSPVAAPSSPAGLSAEDSGTIDNVVNGLTKLKELIKSYEEQFLASLKEELLNPANTGKTLNDVLWNVKNGECEIIAHEIMELVSGTSVTPDEPQRKLGLADYLTNQSFQKMIKSEGNPAVSKSLKALTESSEKIANVARGQLDDKGRAVIQDANKKIVNRGELLFHKTSDSYPQNTQGEAESGLIRILHKKDIRKDFISFFNRKLDASQKAQFQPLFDKINNSFPKAGSGSTPAPTPPSISDKEMEQARDIMKNFKLREIKALFGDDYGEFSIEDNLDMRKFMDSVATKISEFVESTGPASKASGIGQEAFLNNKGEMVVNGEVVDQSWVDGVRDAIGTLVKNLGINLEAEETKILTSVNPLVNPKYALIYVFLDDFVNLFRQKYFEDMTFPQVERYLSKNYPDVIFGICDKIMRASEKYKIEYGAIDKPVQVEPGGTIFVKSYKGVKDYAVFKFGPVSSGLYNIGYRELLNFMKVNKSTIDLLLKQNKTQEAAEMLYKGAMKYAYLHELAAHKGDFESFTSKFAKSQFFDEISNVSESEVLTARRNLRMFKLAQSVGNIKTQDELTSQKALLDRLKKNLEELKKDPEKNAGIIPDREKKISVVQKQVDDYEKTLSEGADFGGKVPAPIDPAKKSAPQNRSDLPSIKMGASDEEIINYHLKSIKSILGTQLDIFANDPYSLRKLQLALESSDHVLDELTTKYAKSLTPEQKLETDNLRQQVAKKLDTLEPIVEKIMQELGSSDVDADAEEVMSDIEQQIKEREGDMAKVVELLEFVPDKKQNITRAKSNLKKYPRIALFLETVESGRKFLAELKKAEELIKSERKAF